MGRFINADAYIATGQGLLSYNMFAYCNNNPINCIDETGMFPWLVVGIVIGCIVLIGADHLLAANQPEGGFVLAEETKSNGTKKKGLYAKGHGFEIDNNGVTVCDIDAGLVSFTYENEYIEAELLDCLTASATAEVDWSGTFDVDISAAASIYSPAIEVVVPLGAFSMTLKGEAYIGAVGAGIAWDVKRGKFKIAPPFAGVGSSVSVDFDLLG